MRFDEILFEVQSQSSSYWEIVAKGLIALFLCHEKHHTELSSFSFVFCSSLSLIFRSAHTKLNFITSLQHFNSNETKSSSLLTPALIVLYPKKDVSSCCVWIQINATSSMVSTNNTTSLYRQTCHTACR